MNRTFTLTFALDSDSFRENEEEEIARTLETAAKEIRERGRRSWVLRDSNGNTIGDYFINELR